MSGESSAAADIPTDNDDDVCMRCCMCFIGYSKEEDAAWNVIKPEVFSAIMDHFASGEPIVRAAVPSGEVDGEAHPHQISPGDSETVQMIKELLETRFVTGAHACTRRITAIRLYKDPCVSAHIVPPRD